MKQFWPKKNPEIQESQDKVFVELANPKLFNLLKELTGLIDGFDEEPRKDYFEAGVLGQSSDLLNPEQLTYKNELLARLQKALNDPELLAEKQKYYLIKVYLEEVDVDQFAEQVGLKPQSIKEVINSAFHKIRGSKYFIDLKPTSAGKGKLNI